MDERTRSRLAELRRGLAAGELDRRQFLRSAIGLGVSVATAYAIIGELAAGTAGAASRGGIDYLRRRVQQWPEGEVVDLPSPADLPSEDAAAERDVAERIARLKKRFARTPSRQGTLGASDDSDDEHWFLKHIAWPDSSGSG